jgi:FixJ family two-component response regulator
VPQEDKVTEGNPVIVIVDDDRSMRESAEMMLIALGFDVRIFISAKDFLEADIKEEVGCLILDVRMPGMSGLELQEKLVSARPSLPVIFITGHGTIPMSVRAMKAGAVDFLPKPFEEQDLLDAINSALSRQREMKSKHDEAAGIRQHFNALTPREQEVFSLLVTGKANKEVAHELGTSERTIKAHRASIMEKMHAGSLADLVRFAERLKATSQDC